jgi:hypothetical protein
MDMAGRASLRWRDIRQFEISSRLALLRVKGSLRASRAAVRLVAGDLEQTHSMYLQSPHYTKNNVVQKLSNARRSDGGFQGCRCVKQTALTGLHFTRLRKKVFHKPTSI